jgi:hypothetical protein
VREESQLDDMRSAIRGDFERLAKRRGEQDLMRVPGEAEGQVHVTEEADEPGAEEPRRRSWLARLLAP